MRPLLPFFCLSLNAFLPSQERQQVHQAEDHDPHAVNEMPVHLRGLYWEMLLGSEITSQRAQQDNQQDE